jgi:cation diffusion facilitator family transporter
MQSAIEEKNRQFAAKLSLAVSFVVLGTKLAAYFMTRSTAVLSDATESIINVIAAVIALFVIYYVAQPADEEHPYGHGKLEYFSAAFEGGLIFFAAIAITGEAVLALIKGEGLNQLEFGMILVGIATLFNLGLGLYLLKVAKNANSVALKASGQHVLSDVWTTVGVVIGLLLVKLTGWIWIDPVVAILVAIQLAYSGWKIVRSSIGALIDEVDQETVQELCDSFNANRREGFIDVHQLKVIRSGQFHHIDAHLVIPQFWDIAKSHEWAEEFEQGIVSHYPFEGEIAFHLDPCKKIYCESCRLQVCPIRQKDFKAEREITTASVVRPGAMAGEMS